MPAHRKYFTPEEEKEALRAAVLRYKRTPKGFLTRLYAAMKHRTTNPHPRKAHLYKGKELLPKEDFNAWVEETYEEFKSLFDNYVDSGFEMRLAPPIDRIDSEVGYVIGNIRWCTHSENSKHRKGGWKWKKNQ